MTKYENVIFLQNHQTEEVFAILDNEGKEAALKHLQQWHYPDEHDSRPFSFYYSSQDRHYSVDGYTMYWNKSLEYMGLEHKAG
jgi:hypothetical protein